MIFPPLPPSVGMAILAVAAAIMAVRPEHFTKIEKVGWVFVACGLFAVEMRSITLERNENEREQAILRKNERDAFQDIAKGIRSTVTTAQQGFDATAKRMDLLTTLSAEISAVRSTGKDRRCQ